VVEISWFLDARVRWIRSHGLYFEFALSYLLIVKLISRSIILRYVHGGVGCRCESSRHIFHAFFPSFEIIAFCGLVLS